MVGRQLNKILGIFFCLAMGLSTLAKAEQYNLFYTNTSGVPQAADDYDQTVAKLKSGDKITFANGATFTIDEVLGSGATTKVVSVKERPGQALRFPKIITMSEYINHIPSGYRTLYERGVNIVGIGEYLPFQYVFVEKLPENTYSFNDFARKEKISAAGREKISAELHEKMRNAFQRFLLEAASLSSIGDFGGGQIKYDPKTDRWILHDWLESHFESLYIDNRGQVQIRKSMLLSSFFEKLRALMRNKEFEGAYKDYQWLFNYFAEMDAEILKEQERLATKIKLTNGKIDYRQFNRRIVDSNLCHLAYSTIDDHKATIDGFEIIFRTKP